MRSKCRRFDWKNDKEYQAKVAKELEARKARLTSHSLGTHAEMCRLAQHPRRGKRSGGSKRSNRRRVP